jgi:hypothetical protein
LFIFANANEVFNVPGVECQAATRGGESFCPGRKFIESVPEDIMPKE